MKNKLTDLNNYLFAQLERISDEKLEGADLKDEIARTDAITSVAAEIIGNAKVMLDAYKNISECWHGKPPALLGLDILSEK